MKKMISLMLAVIIAVPGFSFAYGSTNQSQGLEDALKYTKSILTIPDSLTDFTYDASESQTRGKKGTRWHLNWGNTEGTKTISASVDENNNLLSYYYYDNEDGKKTGLSTISRTTAQKTANAFIERIMPDIGPQMIVINEKKDQLETYAHVFTYCYVHEGIQVPEIGGRITINRHTGQINEYQGLWAGFELPAFAQTTPEVNAEKARQIYMDELGIELSYYSNYNYQKKELTLFPAYYFTSTWNKVIDAKTGKIITPYAGQKNSSRAMDYEMADGVLSYDGGSFFEKEVILSPEEIAAVDTVSGLLSKEEGERIIRTFLPVIPKNTKVTQFHLNQDFYDQEKYVYAYSFENIFATIDAKTGEILSFAIREADLFPARTADTGLLQGSEGKEETNISTDEAKLKAEEMLKKINADKFSQSRFDNEEEMSFTPLSISDWSDVYSFKYYREVNGILVKDNYMRIEVDKKTGECTSFYSQWYDTAQFPPVNAVIDSDKAFAIYNEGFHLNLCYAYINQDQVGLVYRFEEESHFYLSPETGNKLNHDGTPYTERTGLPDYKDLKGTSYEKIVTELKNNGYYLQGEFFEGEKEITQIDFLRYLYSNPFYEDDEQFLDYLKGINLVKEEEWQPEAALKRQDGAKFLIRYLGLQLAAEQTDIYKNMFTDEIDPAYLGYSALCYSLGIMDNEKDHAFRGNDPLLRGQAAEFIYKMLKADHQK